MKTFHIQDGWIQEARKLPSPNYDARPADMQIDLLVIHGISLPPGEFGGPWIDELFLNRLDAAAHPYFAEIEGMTVSSHILIRRDGEVVQYVSLLERAWHAGKSCFEGRERCNDFAIGIELEGTDELPYEPVQYERLTAVTKTIQLAFPFIRDDRIVGHADIAPGRKTDPGPAFDWHRYRSLLENLQ